MHDRDGLICRLKSIIGVCSDVHDHSLFSIQSLTQPSKHRQCMGANEELWVCPHETISYKELMMLQHNRKSSMCGCFQVSVRGGGTAPVISCDL